jgi:hypothetical protein
LNQKKQQAREIASRNFLAQVGFLFAPVENWDSHPFPVGSRIRITLVKTWTSRTPRPGGLGAPWNRPRTRRQGLTVGRGRKAIQHLVDLLPSVATVRRSGSWIDVKIGDVTTDDEVLVRPGGRIPVDGKVVGGHSFVDQAPITGESMPVEKRSGAIVYAGTINQSGALEIRVERLGRDTSFGKII